MTHENRNDIFARLVKMLLAMDADKLSEVERFILEPAEPPKLYNNVKRLAKKKGFTISGLEKAAGLSNGVIGKWRASSNGVRISSLEAISKVLEVPVETLTKN